MAEIPLLTELAKFGLLGLLLALVSWIAWNLKGELIKSWESRLVDAKAMMEVINAVRVTISEATQAAVERSRAQESSARATEHLAEELSRLRESNDKLCADVSRLREWLITTGRAPPGGA
jgi:biopolymer transport protein ExbB/TolQ